MIDYGVKGLHSWIVNGYLGLLLLLQTCSTSNPLKTVSFIDPSKGVRVCATSSEGSAEGASRAVPKCFGAEDKLHAGSC